MHEQLPGGIIEVYEDRNVKAVTFGKPFNARLLFSTSHELDTEQTEERTHLLKTIKSYAAQENVSVLAVPRVDHFNARITNISILPINQTEHITDDVQLLRGEQEVFFNDGFVLWPGEGAVIVTGDCHTIVFCSGNPDEPIVAVHAGRNSLHQINHVHITGTDSVVFEALTYFKDPTSVHARIIAGIGPDAFTHFQDHPQHGTNNQAMLACFAQFAAADPNDPEGHIDVATAIREQIVSRGVPLENISHDKLDTFTNDHLWSNRRGERQRNAVLVMHRKK